MDEEARAAAYLRERQAMVAARDTRLNALSGDETAAARLRDKTFPLLPPRFYTTADDDLPQRADAPEEL